MKANPRYPHKVVITRPGESDPFSEDEAAPMLIYEGVCRSYQKEYVSSTGYVMVSKRVLALPVSLTEWMDVPKEKDNVVVDYGCYKEQGIVIDKQPNNLGTDIYWEYGRN
jgi:hypothetical protein|nr:MAG TPA: hypothetical protein [Caudoviricetes sp.]